MKTAKAIALVTGGFVAGIATVFGTLWGLYLLEGKIEEEEIYEDYDNFKVGGSE